MNRRRLMLAGLGLAGATALVAACVEPERHSVVPVPFTVSIEHGTLRPAGSSIGIVGNDPSLGATADAPKGDPLKALKLRQTPDDHWLGAAWLPPGQDVDYQVFMLNPPAPEVVGDVLPDGGTEATPDGGVRTHHIRWDGTTPRFDPGDSPTDQLHVTQFDVPLNLSRPCITFVVTVPSVAVDAVYIAGDDEAISAWNPGVTTLAKNADGTWGGTFCFDSGKDLAYKYMHSAGSWSGVEKNADGSERADRHITVSDTAFQVDTVEKWADL